MENNNADTMGNYTQTNSGTPIYSSTIYHNGAYSFKNTNCSTNLIKLPTGIETYLSGVTAGYTIECWFRVDAFTDSYALLYQKQGNVNNTGGAWIVLANATGAYGTDLFVKWNGNNDHSYTAFNSATNLTQWHDVALSYDKVNNRLNVYYDNALIGTVNSAGDIFANNDGNEFVGGSTQFSWTATYYIDNFLISDTPRTSFPSGPIPTPTITPTNTKTATPTITPTSTKIITQTITQTSTKTQTVTPTNTSTITPTSTRTVTRTVTPTITTTNTQTATVTPTITPTPYSPVNGPVTLTWVKVNNSQYYQVCCNVCGVRFTAKAKDNKDKRANYFTYVLPWVITCNYYTITVSAVTQSAILPVTIIYKSDGGIH